MEQQQLSCGAGVSEGIHKGPGPFRMHSNSLALKWQNWEQNYDDGHSLTGGALPQLNFPGEIYSGFVLCTSKDFVPLWYPLSFLGLPWPGTEELNKHITQGSSSTPNPVLWGFPMTSQLSGFGCPSPKFTAKCWALLVCGSRN